MPYMIQVHNERGRWEQYGFAWYIGRTRALKALKAAKARLPEHRFRIKWSA